jgi:hypothetical protein
VNARDTIAQVLHRKCVMPSCSGPTTRDYEDADAVIAAVRAMPVEDQADLIGAETVEHIGRNVLLVRSAHNPWYQS